MLAGEIDLIDGCQTVLRYREHLADPMPALFLMLVGVESETGGAVGLRRRFRRVTEYEA